MKTHVLTKTSTDKIKRKLKVKRYDMDQFFAACPFTISDLKSPNRSHELMCWRHLGMAWGVLSGKTLDRSASIFNRVHSMSINALKNVLHCIEGYGSPIMAEAIKRVVEHAKTDGFYVPPYAMTEFLDVHIGDPDLVKRLTPLLLQTINDEATR